MKNRYYPLAKIGLIPEIDQKSNSGIFQIPTNKFLDISHIQSYPWLLEPGIYGIGTTEPFIDNETINFSLTVSYASNEGSGQDGNWDLIHLLKTQSGKEYIRTVKHSEIDGNLEYSNFTSTEIPVLIFEDWVTTLLTKEGDPDQTYVRLSEGSSVKMSVISGGGNDTYFNLSGNQSFETTLMIDGSLILYWEPAISRYVFNGNSAYADNALRADDANHADVASNADYANIADSCDTANQATNSEFSVNSDVAVFASESGRSYGVGFISGEAVLILDDDSGNVELKTAYGSMPVLWASSEETLLYAGLNQECSLDLSPTAGFVQLMGNTKNVVKYDWNEGDFIIIGETNTNVVLWPKHEANSVGLHKVLISSQDDSVLSYMTKAEFKTWLNS